MKTRVLVGQILTLLLIVKVVASNKVSLPPPRWIRAVDVDPFTAKLSWQVPRDARANETRYRIGWKAGSNSKESYVVVNGTKGYHVFNNLHPYVYYYFRVQRGTVSGTYGDFSRSIWMETPETKPTAPPTNVSAYNTSSMGILVHWSAVPPQHRNGHILGFKACYHKASEPSTKGFCLSVYALSIHIGGLEPYTPYYVSVLAYTNVGDGPGSPPLLVWTDEFVPSRAPVITVIIASTTTIILRWQPIPQKYVRGIPRGYDLAYHEAADYGSKKVIRLNTTFTSYVIKNLKRNTMYGVRIAGLTRVRGFLRNGKISPTWNVTTRPGCQAPTNVNAYSLCSKCMTVQWTKVPAINPQVIIIGYRVTLKAENTADIIKDVGSSKQRADITGLKPYTKYTITVAADTDGGFGDFNSPISQVTQEGVPSVAPKQVSVESKGPNSILVKWSPLSSKDVNGVLMGYNVYYKNIVARTKRSDSAGVVHATNISSPSVEIVGLKPFSLYEITVAAFTKKGNGPLSAPATIRTDEEVPSRAPDGLMAKPKTVHSILVTWQPLQRHYTNGVLKGYHVNYRMKTADSSVIKNVVTVNASILNVTIKGLEPNTQYEVWLEAFTAKGAGPSSNKVTIATLKIVPSQPRDLKVEVINPRTVKITWASALSDVTSYMVKWTQRGQPGKSAVDNQKIVKISGVYKRTTTITGLTPYQMYTFTVRELSKGSWGEPFSETVDQIMPEDAPSAPLDLSVFKKDGPTLVLSWRKPEHSNGVIRKYVLYFADHKGVELWKDTVNDGLSEMIMKHTFVLPDKTADYKITVQAFNSKPGEKSEVITVQHVSNDDTVGYVSKANNRIKLPWLIFIISAIVLFVLCIVVFILIRKSNKRAKNNQPEEEMIAMIPKSFGARRPIPVDDLKRHCDRYHAYDDALFIEEFKSLNHILLRSTYEASQTSYNKNKNRYQNILPYDHSRVVLKTRKDSPPGSDYINASHIDGYGCPRKYIATQGPLKETVDDFWRMVWEKECTTIVMLGDIENSLKLRSDCEKYWPEHGHQEYGDLAVSIVDEIHMSDWSIRTFLVWSTDPECMDKREVTQYQYTAWPDQGVPENTASILIFQHKLRVGLPLETGPIVVHCGAGVGRTGTFIAIDSLLDQRLMEGVVDVYGFVAQMRTQRNSMVQTEDQYSFIHDVLRDASICGITEIHSQEIGARLLVLCDNDPEVSRRRFDEFDNLPVYEPETFEHSVAYIRENIVKNRCPDVLPFDVNRVRISGLSSSPGIADYINASYIDGYNEGRAYIATQAPMENTVTEFWQMVWEQRCTAIVMLAGLTDKAGQEECVQYWPIQGCLRYGKYIVTKIDEEMLDDHTQRVLKLRCHGSMESLLVYHFQYHNWPRYGVPPRVNGLVCLHEQIQKIQLVEDHGPTIVHCSDGAGRTGMYLTLAISIERLEAEDNIDVFQTVRWLRSQRPGMVGSAEQYNFCYQAVKSYLSWRTRATNDYVTA